MNKQIRSFYKPNILDRLFDFTKVCLGDSSLKSELKKMISVDQSFATNDSQISIVRGGN